MLDQAGHSRSPARAPGLPAALPTRGLWTDEPRAKGKWWCGTQLAGSSRGQAPALGEPAKVNKLCQPKNQGLKSSCSWRAEVGSAANSWQRHGGSDKTCRRPCWWQFFLAPSAYNLYKSKHEREKQGAQSHSEALVCRGNSCVTRTKYLAWISSTRSPSHSVLMFLRLQRPDSVSLILSHSSWENRGLYSFFGRR